MIIEEKKLYDFLDDASRHELHFSRGRQNCLLIKSAFDAETDFFTCWRATTKMIRIKPVTARPTPAYTSCSPRVF